MTRPYSTWRQWLSYAFDQTLFHGPGQHGDQLKVKVRQGKVLLEANGAVYSWEDNYYNFREAFGYLDWEALPNDRVLLLGLGLGSVPQIAEELFGQVHHYTAIEYDGVVANLAQTYLLHRLESRVDVVVEDAASFVNRAAGGYGLILVDLFVDDAIPEKFQSLEFLRKLNTLLAKGGCLVTNRLAHRTEDKAAAQAYVEDVFCEVFSQADYLDVHSNWMLFSDTRFLVEPPEPED